MSSIAIHGIDFTSAPSKRKPIICVSAWLDGAVLQIDQLRRWTSFQPFEDFLRGDDPFVAGLDFPFGQPSALIQQLAWKSSWDDYVGTVASHSKHQFVQTLLEFSESQPTGSKHLFRRTDRITSACSPMMVYGVPVAKMFYEGATRLRNSTANIVPCRPRGCDRTTIEAYPALVSRFLLPKTKYKSNRANPEHRAARNAMLQVLSEKVLERYGVRVSLTGSIVDECLRDNEGDVLDATFCCVQAAWANTQKNFGIPDGINREEGWIVDPSCLAQDGAIATG